MTQLGGLKVETRQLAGFGRDRMSDAIVCDVLPQALVDAADIPAQAFGQLPETVKYHAEWQKLLHARTPEFVTLRDQLWGQGGALMGIAAAYQHTDIEAAYDISASRGNLDGKGGNDITPYVNTKLPPISCRPGAAPAFPPHSRSNFHFTYPAGQAGLPSLKRLPDSRIETGTDIGQHPNGWLTPDSKGSVSMPRYQTNKGLEDDQLSSLVDDNLPDLLKADAIAQSLGLTPPMTGRIMKLYLSSPTVIKTRSAACDGIANVVEDINSSFALSYRGLRDEWWTHTPGTGTGSAGAYYNVASATQTYMSDIVTSLRYMSAQGKAISEIIEAMRNGYGDAIIGNLTSLTEAITAYLKAISSGVGSAGSPETIVKGALDSFVSALSTGVQHRLKSLAEGFGAEAKTLLPKSRYDGYRLEHSESKPFPSKTVDRNHDHKPNDYSWKTPKDWRPHTNHPSESDY
ncbi:MAG TPA: hypothetical protein VE172_16420 [Stackebrandtia sp.]|jgi:hypothetical protein|uniref:hypothetical protein n=1 Tax=Stackebrandtia sp. TaxID=2023065 RepID=UPI002D666669|nr:hypothetical protein [Stackebrandtia sp.]HZE40388.1 hypothetical protein [Stackebrandtia sp.]